MNDCEYYLSFFIKVRRYSPAERTERSVSFFEDTDDAYDFASHLYSKHFPEQIENWKNIGI
jgi:hypothetical protein